MGGADRAEESSPRQNAVLLPFLSYGVLAFLVPFSSASEKRIRPDLERVRMEPFGNRDFVRKGLSRLLPSLPRAFLPGLFFDTFFPKGVGFCIVFRLFFPPFYRFCFPFLYFCHPLFRLPPFLQRGLCQLREPRGLPFPSSCPDCSFFAFPFRWLKEKEHFLPKEEFPKVRLRILFVKRKPFQGMKRFPRVYNGA